MQGNSELLDAADFESEPPANLTKAGLAMLREIWELGGKPERPVGDQHAALIELDDLPSHQRNAKSAGAIRGRLMSGGYLNATDIILDSGKRSLCEVGLSNKAFDALADAGIMANRADEPTAIQAKTEPDQSRDARLSARARKAWATRRARGWVHPANERKKTT